MGAVDKCDTEKQDPIPFKSMKRTKLLLFI